ncbi:c-type cytochrome [Parerythrobacter jejuensis]|nr:c-type cytochrome [Parerythrobacter jejuensis]
MKIALIPAIVLLMASGCAPYGSSDNSVQSAKASAPPLSAAAVEGKRLSESLCSGCHAVTAGQISPNPSAPGFERIANMDSLTEESLRDWLRDSHNFPEKMNFEVVDEDVAALAAYIITLRKEGYNPPIE